MARQIYSFTKIEKKKTNAGLITLLTGIITMAALMGMLIAAAVLKGELPYQLAGTALISLLVAVGGLFIANTARRDDDTFGRFLNAGYISCMVSVCAHLLIFLIGILVIIM